MNQRVSSLLFRVKYDEIINDIKPVSVSEFYFHLNVLLEGLRLTVSPTMGVRHLTLKKMQGYPGYDIEQSDGSMEYIKKNFFLNELKFV